MSEFPKILSERLAEALAQRLDRPSFIGPPVRSEDEATPVFHRNEFAIRVSREMALDYGLVEPTPEEAAKRAKQAEQWRETRRPGHEQTVAYAAALDAIADPVTRAVLDLHTCKRTDDYPDCEGCDFSGFDGEPPPWPCQTVDLIADMHGIEKPIYVTFRQETP